MAARHWIAANYPEVRLLALPENLGFGGGSNAGFRAAKNDIVVLLNSDMRVERDFLAPLLAGFTDEAVFAVSCQIFFGDPTKRREETGLTQAWWRTAAACSHREEAEIDGLFPCFYGGGGSCAFDRRKFLELGGFDQLLAPFYLEDTDLGYLAWKRGWKVLYQPRAWCITNIAARSANASARLTFNRSCRRISCFSAGKISTSGAGWLGISSLHSPAPW